MSTLLVINDDPVQLHLLGSLLEQDHKHVVRFTSSESAWQWLQDGHAPDAIILDLHMPGINGWRFCELLHMQVVQGQSVPPILVVSATYSGMDAEDVLSDLGASAFLPLPAEPARIRQQVQKLLEEPVPPKAFHAWVVSSDISEIKRTRSVFEHRGWEVYGWQSGMDMLSESSLPAPDMIIIDDPLSDVNTHDLLAWRKREYPQARALVMSLQGSRRGSSRFGNESDVYLPKGCDPETLMTLSEKWCRERAFTHVEHLLEVRTSDLKESEAQFQGLFEILPDILVIYDDQRLIRHINTSGAQQLGYVSADLLGTPLVGIHSSILNGSVSTRHVEVEQLSPRWIEAT